MIRYCLLVLLFAVLIGCSDDETSDFVEPPDGSDPTLNQQAVGVSANDLLSTTSYSSLRVELVSVSGFEPTAQTINNLRSFLQARVNKPSGINIVTSEIESPNLAPYSISDIVSIENEQRSRFNSGDELVVFIFIADGNFSQNENVLGVAYQNTSFALFGQKIDEISGSVLQPSSTLVESTVMHHEFAHLMGLVNVGTPLQSDHQDEEHGKHCDVENCLMFFSLETSDVVDLLLASNQVPSLDSQCIADLRANGGK